MIICKIENCLNFIYHRELCTVHYWAEWRRVHQPKSIASMNKKRFGGLREKIIQRDHEKCVKCNMTRKEHFKKWGKDITVDHIDKKGRNSQIPNNIEDNLQTLCLQCHGSKDAIQHGRYSVYRVN